MSTSTSDISIRIQLDANRVPETIEWQASDAHQAHPSESKSVFLALLDKETLDTSTFIPLDQRAPGSRNGSQDFLCADCPDRRVL